MLFDCDENGDIDIDYSQRQLDEFDAVLSSPKFSHLKAINLNIACKRLGHSLDPKVQNHINLHTKNILPVIRSMSSVKFSIRMTDYVF